MIWCKYHEFIAAGFFLIYVKYFSDTLNVGKICCVFFLVAVQQTLKHMFVRSLSALMLKAKTHGIANCVSFKSQAVFPRYLCKL